MVVDGKKNEECLSQVPTPEGVLFRVGDFRVGEEISTVGFIVGSLKKPDVDFKLIYFFNRYAPKKTSHLE
jgi:hypothetical protein